MAKVERAGGPRNQATTTAKTPPLRVGAVLYEARRAVGMTQAELGKRVGVRNVTVCRWESDAVFPSRRSQGEVVAVLRAKNPALATRLAVAFGLERAPEPPAPAAPVKLTGQAAFVLGMFTMADQLGVPAPRMRSAFRQFLAAMDAGGVATGALRAMHDAWAEDMAREARAADMALAASLEAFESAP